MEMWLTPYLLQLFAAIVVIYFLPGITRWLIRYIKNVMVVNKIPGPITMWPFIGNAHQLKTGSDFFGQIITEINKVKCRSILRLWLGTQPVVVLNTADYAEFILSSSKYIDKSCEYRYLHPWLKTGLLTSTGEKWTKRRKIITPSFHFDILNDFLFVMNEQSDVMVKILEKQANTNKGFNICPYISSCALDIICETAMGQNVKAQTDKTSKYVDAVIQISELVFARMKYPIYSLDFIFNNSKLGKEHDHYLSIIHKFTRNVIEKRAVELEEEGILPGHRIAFLDTLLKYRQDDPTITFDDIQEEVDTFMFEGHDTTAAAAAWACHLIGSHPEVQAKLHEELDSVFGDSDRPITNQDLSELKYLECVIKETLRLYPSVAFYARSMYEDAVCHGYTIPKGTTVIIFAFIIHRDEKYYPDPEKFDPDRFLPENSINRHAYAYVPFSAGKRNCIGQRFALMEEKVLLASLLRKYKITALQTRKELVPDFEIILRPGGSGIQVRLDTREKRRE